MNKNEKVNVKLEINKDKQSGKLMIIAHFNKDSSNIIIKNDEYIWMPTIEEKDLLNEAFNFFPLEKTPTKNTPKHSEEEKEHKTPEIENQEPVIKESLPPLEPETEINPTKNQEVEANKTIEKKPIKSEEPAIFEVTSEIPQKDIEPQESNKELDVKVDVKIEEPQQNTSESVEDKKIIVEADQEAIEKALKKHSKKEEDDQSIKEADEQTIIDKVLNQKKKGKWSRFR